MGCIHQCCLNLHHALHSSVTSRFHSLHSIHCSHCCSQVLHMGIHIHIHYMGCILRSLMMTDHLHCSQHTNKYHNRNRNNLRDMDNHIRCCYNPSNHILRSNHCYHHSSHHSTSTNHPHVGCLMSNHSLRSIHCSHCCSQVLRMGIRIHIRCMG